MVKKKPARKKKANPVGSPSKYKKEYCKIAQDMLSEDKPLCAVCAEVGVCQDTFNRWISKHPELSIAVKNGRDKGKALFLDRVERAAWDTETYKVNNGLITLLAINKHQLTTANSKSNDKLEVKGEIKTITRTIVDPNES